MYRILLCLFFIASVASNAQDAAYRSSMQHFYNLRKQALTSEDGWLNLAGLFWLKDGANRMGNDPSNDIVMQHKDMPPFAGIFYRNANEVWWESAENVNIRVNDSLVKKRILFSDGKPRGRLAIGSLRWSIISRDDKIGIRMRDIAAEAVIHYEEPHRFPLSLSYRVKARLEKKIQVGILINNVIGQSSIQESPGTLVFHLNGKTYRLDALQEGNELFIVFGDASNGKETYAAGRFLYADMPGADGEVLLDFNRSINPPCAFTDFATCPLPPQQNILPVPVLAGEKDYHPNRKLRK